MKKCECCKEKITSDNSPYGAIYVENYGYICEECFKNNYELKLLKVHKENNSNNFSMLIKEKLTKHTFWIDCFELEEEKGFYKWDFNQYIFHLCDSKDVEAKKMQDFFNRNDNIENFDCLIDCLIYEAVKIGGIKNENYN